jgi:hypothetical protein
MRREMCEGEGEEEVDAISGREKMREREKKMMKMKTSRGLLY